MHRIQTRAPKTHFRHRRPYQEAPSCLSMENTEIQGKFPPSEIKQEIYQNWVDFSLPEWTRELMSADDATLSENMMMGGTEESKMGNLEGKGKMDSKRKEENQRKIGLWRAWKKMKQHAASGMRKF